MLKTILFLIITSSKTGLTTRNGTEININDRPYQVAVNTNYWKYLFAECHCGGTIISKNYVLTAAHCVDKDQEYVVRAGSSECSWYGTIYRIKTKIIHSNFSINPYLMYDLAILEMDEEIQFTEFVKPIKMAEKGFKTDRFLVEMSGYGKSNCCEDCPNNRQLSMIQLKMLSADECSIVSSDLSLSRTCYLEKRFIPTTCCGDAGGPVTLVNDNKLIGVLSFGCDGLLGSWTWSSFIPEFREWISSITKL